MDDTNARERMLKDYPADDHGTWKILGEDPNCDWGGNHIEPELEVVTGTYSNVVTYALSLRGFYQWGRGGRIVKQLGPVVNVDKISLVNPKVSALEAEAKQLAVVRKQLEIDNKKISARLIEIDNEIRGLKR